MFRLQIGSGLGYWAKLLRDRDVNVKAYDKVAGKPAKEVVSSSNSEVKGDRRVGKGKLADTTTQWGVKRRKGMEEGEKVDHEAAPPAFWTEVSSSEVLVLRAFVRLEFKQSTTNKQHSSVVACVC